MEPEAGREETRDERARLTFPASAHSRAFFASTILVLLATAAVWIPFPKAPGLVEEWSILWAFDRGQPRIAPDVISNQPTRPLLSLAYALGHALTPDSFRGLYLVHLIFSLGKGLVAAALVRRLRPGDPALAALAAALFVVFPADRALLMTRATAYQLSSFFLLLAVLFLFRFVREPRIAAALGIAGCQVVALGTYESGYPLLLAAPLAVFLLPDRPAFTRPAVARLFAVWYTVPVFLGALTLSQFLRVDTYQGHLFRAGEETPAVRTLATLKALSGAVLRTFGKGWLEAGRGIETLSAGELCAAAVPALAALLLLLSWKPEAVPGARARSLVATGLAAVVLGVVPFMVAPELRGQTWRVYLLSSFGASLVFAAVLTRVRDLRGGRPIAALAAAALVFVADSGARSQRRLVEETGLEERNILHGIVGAMPDPAPAVLVLFLDREGPPRTEELFGLTITDVHLADALRVVYRRADVTLLFFGRPMPSYWNGRPEAAPDGVRVSYADGRSALYPYERVIAFREDGQGRVSLLDILPSDLFPFPGAARYAPRPLLGSGPPPSRLATLVP